MLPSPCKPITKQKKCIQFFAIIFVLVAAWATPAIADDHCGGADEKICGDGVFKRYSCNPGLRGEWVGLTIRCKPMDRIAEPTTNVNQLDTTYQSQPSGQPLRGYADLHAHMFSNEAFGGLVLWGQPFNFGGVNRALPPDDFSYHVDAIYTALGINFSVAGTIKGQPVHGKNHGDLPFSGDPIGKGLHDGAGSNNNGIAPSSDADGGHDFTGWPRSTSTTHQQMYYKWLERAYQGGMRLMVMLAVNNEVLCRVGIRKKHRDCKQNMQDIDIQLSNAYLLQTYVDMQNGGAGKGWFRIVKSPAEARQVIEDGKLAVVLGIETESLFNCKKAGDCSQSFIRSEVEKYYNRGVRHMFPIHDFDNEFGGAATFKSAINTGNRIARGEYFSVRDCAAEGYNFKFGGNALDPFLLFLLGGITDSPSYPSSFGAHCNTKGLSSKGEFLMNEFMDKGMVIDIDHMSALGVERALQIAEARNYPLVASHVNFVDQQVEKSEKEKTHAQLQRIRNLGGMVGVGVFKGGDRAEFIQYDDDNNSATPAPVTNDCGNSSKIFAQKYLQAVEEMGPLGVALGTDFNGMTQHPGPRFGPVACRNPATGLLDGSPQTNEVQYPFTIPGFGTFDKQVTGDRTFNFNTDGLAHVGLVPDLIADLKNIGVTDTDLDPLFNSAEAYIQMWERSEAASDTTSPEISAPADITVNTDPGKATAVVDFAAATATDNSGSVTVTQTAGPASGSAFSIGSTTITWEAEDEAGNTAEASIKVTVVDNEFPVITAPADITVNSDPGQETAIVSFASATATDNSGSVTVTQTVGPASGSAFSSGTTTVTWEAEDGAGNISEASMTVTVTVDNEAPVITPPASVTKEATGQQTVVNLVAPTVTDNVGVVSLDNNAPATFGLGDTTVTWTATDAAGNEGKATQTVTIEDTTAPVITVPGNVTEEATGLQTIVAIGTATGTDAVGPVTITSNAPATFGLGDTVVTWTATDAYNNFSTGTQTVTVEDTTAPVITVPGNVTKEATGLQTIVAIGTATGTDAVGPVTITSNAPATFGLGDTVVTWTATDAYNNFSTGTQTVTVEDTTAPVITVPGNVTEEATGLQTIVAIGTATGTDAVGPVTITSNAPATFGLGDTVVTWTATDAYNNFSTGTQTVTVEDTTPPVITGPANVTEEATGLQTIVAIGTATGTDAVGPVTITSDAPATFGLGDTIVTWTATDAYNNSSTATQTVTVEDTTAPAFDLNQLATTVWPVNKRMVDAATVANVSDAVDANPSVVLTVTSNQSISSSDWNVAGNTVSVKADRSGKDGDRVYTVTATVTDFSGNSSSQSVEVVVPHDQGESKSGGKKK
jgi:microsomal dipeptidase-like Zn-dependent dipeptidase